MTLRPYQTDLIRDVRGQWQSGARNVLMRLDTGGGKTKILSSIAAERQADGPVAVIAHRNELVSQLSLALASNGLVHDLVCSRANARAIAQAQVEELGTSYLDPNAPVRVVSVDTMLRRTDELASWAQRVKFWVVDEGHHVLKSNKWGKALQEFTHPDVQGLLPTATPRRADGYGLGRHADGVVDVMVEGPPGRWLMDQGYLSRYRVACVDSHIEQYLTAVAASGDYSPAALKRASQETKIVGDVVQSYLQFAPGKLGVTFASDVDTAVDMARSYRDAGVPADVLTGATDVLERVRMMRRFRQRQILQLVVVDVLSEGVDVPACDVVTMARKTESLGLFLQQLGRGLRPSEGKQFLQLIDHVGNFLSHGGGPDVPRIWSLDRQEKRSKSPDDAIPIEVCLNVLCGQPYEKFRSCCPHCGQPKPGPRARATPAQVAGNLTLLDDSILAALRGDIDVVDMPPEDYARRLLHQGCPAVGISRNVRLHRERQEVQAALREAMAIWAGPRHASGMPDGDIQSEFYLRYGIDVLSAQALNASDASELLNRVVTDL